MVIFIYYILIVYFFINIVFMGFSVLCGELSVTDIEMKFIEN